MCHKRLGLAAVNMILKEITVFLQKGLREFTTNKFFRIMWKYFMTIGYH